MIRKLGIIFLLMLINSTATAQSRIIRLEFGQPDPKNINLPLKQEPKRKKIGLALSGGGARGFTQIGVLKVLEKNGIPIDYIAGTSMGGVVGGLFATGYSSEELERLALKINWEDALKDSPNRLSMFLSQREESEGYFLKIRFDKFKPYMPTGLTSGQKITNLFSNLTARANYQARANFDYLKIPFRAVATDLETGEKVVLGSGDLAEALRATISVPLAFAPVEIDKRILVDGGLVEPVPVETVRKMGADIVIAINTSGNLLGRDKIKNPIDIADQTTSIMSLDKKQEELSQADFVISPDLKRYSAISFDKVKELISIGESATEQNIMDLKEKIIQKDGPANETYYLTRIVFEGAKQMEKDTLESICLVHAGKSFSMQEIKQSLEKLYDSGYFSDAFAELIPSDSGYILVFHLTENGLLETISFQGNKVFTASQLENKLFLQPEEILNSQKLRQGIDRILEMYNQKGYALSNVRKISFDSGHLLVEMDEGIISQIELEGNLHTKSWVILRSFPLKAGKPFNSFMADEGIKDIYATGLFDKVILEITPGLKGPILKIKIKEKDFTFLRLGAHYTDEYNFETALQIVDANVLGIGNQAYTDVMYGDKRQRYGIHFKADRIYKSYLTYKTDIFHNREIRKIYSDHKQTDSLEERRSGMVFSLGQHISRLGTLFLETKLERAELRESKTFPYQAVNIRSVILRSMVDTFDKYPFPDRGKYHHLYVEIAGKVLDGNSTFRKGFTSLESYFPLNQHWNFHPRIAFGMSDGNLPLSEKFLLGGYDRFYGFFEDELVGDKLFYSNMEIRLKFWKRFYWNIRYDAGSVWSNVKDLKVRNIYNAIGTGLAIDTPIGPIQVHYGYAGKDTDKFYFRAGFEF